MWEKRCEYLGRTLTLSGWARYLKLSLSTFADAVNRLGYLRATTPTR